MATGMRSQPLRAGLLDDVELALVSAESPEASGSFAPAISANARELGARVHDCPLAASAGDPAAQEQRLKDALDGPLARARAAQMLVVDAAGLHAAALAQTSSERAGDALAACLQGTWSAVRTLATAAFLETGRPGRIALVAPPPASDAHAGAALAGLENLARTLGTEWARHRISAVAIAPAAAPCESEVALLIAYLASPAGEYFSGCLLDLRGSGPP